MSKIRFVKKIYNWMETLIYEDGFEWSPRMDKVWNRWSDRLVDGTFGSYVHAAKFFPSVWLKPITETGKGLK